MVVILRIVAVRAIPRGALKTINTANLLPSIILLWTAIALGQPTPGPFVTIPQTGSACSTGLGGVLPRLPGQLLRAAREAEPGSLRWPATEAFQTRLDWMVLGRFTNVRPCENTDWIAGIVDHNLAGVWNRNGEPLFRFGDAQVEPTDAVAIDVLPSGLVVVARLTQHPRRRRLYVSSYTLNPWAPVRLRANFNVSGADLVHIEAGLGHLWTYDSTDGRLCSRRLWGPRAGECRGCYHLPNEPRVLDLGSMPGGEGAYRLVVRYEDRELPLAVTERGLIPTLRKWGDSP